MDPYRNHFILVIVTYLFSTFKKVNTKQIHKNLPLDMFQHYFPVVFIKFRVNPGKFPNFPPFWLMKHQELTPKILTISIHT
jgi:hypothetical protein